jgi:hypothetical protein
MRNQITRLRPAIRRFFARLLGFQRPATPGAIARMRLEEFRRDSSCRWEINPGAREVEASLDLTSGPVFRDESVGGATEQAAGRIRISVSRIRFR